MPKFTRRKQAAALALVTAAGIAVPLMSSTAAQADTGTVANYTFATTPASGLTDGQSLNLVVANAGNPSALSSIEIHLCNSAAINDQYTYSYDSGVCTPTPLGTFSSNIDPAGSYAVPPGETSSPFTYTAVAGMSRGRPGHLRGRCRQLLPRLPGDQRGRRGVLLRPATDLRRRPGDDHDGGADDDHDGGADDDARRWRRRRRRRWRRRRPRRWRRPRRRRWRRPRRRRWRRRRRRRSAADDDHHGGADDDDAGDHDDDGDADHLDDGGADEHVDGLHHVDHHIDVVLLHVHVPGEDDAHDPSEDDAHDAAEDDADHTARTTRTTRPTTTTNPICAVKDQIPDWLWKLVSQLFGVTCP